MNRPSRYAAGLLAVLVVAQTASALTLASWSAKELGPAMGREDHQSLVYELGPPSGPDTSASFSAAGWGKDLHYFVISGPYNWPDGTVVHKTGDGAYGQTGWEAWGGTCFKGLDSTMLAPGFPMPVCVGSDGNVWGFWGANGQFLITINDPQVQVRPAVASRGDWSFDTFYVHSATYELWHTGWSPAGGWIDEPVVVNGTPVYGATWSGGIDAVWAGYGVSAAWANKILVSYIGLDGRAAVLSGAFASSGHAASNNINWTSNAVVSAIAPTDFASVAFVGVPGGTVPTLFYDDGTSNCQYQQEFVFNFPFFGGSFLLWTGAAPIAPNGVGYNGGTGGTSGCGDVAARAAANGSLGSKINFWQPNNFQLWGYSR